MTNKIVLENLSSFTSGVDLHKVPPIHQKRLLTFVNHFIITTVGFLNKFAGTCEQKLLSCDQKMQKLEAELCILEAKLNSIPGLEDVCPIPIATEVPPVCETDKTVPTSQAADPVIPDSPDDQMSEMQSPESESGTPSAAKNPELARFFKMIQFGVPIPAVKLKMQLEGLDGSLLDS